MTSLSQWDAFSGSTLPICDQNELRLDIDRVIALSTVHNTMQIVSEMQLLQHSAELRDFRWRDRHFGRTQIGSGHVTLQNMLDLLKVKEF